MATGQRDWAIRSISRALIVEYLLQHHFGWTFAGADPAIARAEVDGAINTWLEMGLGVAVAPGGEHLFDPVEVLNFMIGAGHRGGDSFWERHHVATQRGHFLVQQGMPPDSRDVPDIAALAPRHFHLRLEREFNLAGLAPAARARLRLPLPIEDHAITDLVIECDVPPGAIAKSQPARLDVALKSGQAARLTIGIDANFKAHVDRGGNGYLDDRERDIYTRPREMLICADDRAADLAKTQVAGKRDEWTRVMALFDYLLDNFQLGAVPYHALDPERPADWSFHTGIYDCHVAAALLCAMCRSLGMPARIINGYNLFPKELSYHYWAEVWLEGRGWVGFDFTAWNLSRGGRDLAWRNLLTGTLDYRIKTQVFPEQFTGPSSVRLPQAWHLLSFVREDVFETTFIDATSGATVYSDRLALI